MDPVDATAEFCDFADIEDDCRVVLAGGAVVAVVVAGTFASSCAADRDLLGKDAGWDCAGTGAAVC